MTFFSFYSQPSCTPGRAAMQTGRIPNRSGMTTVAFQGQGGGLPKAEWTLASVLKTAGYATYFTGKWHLGEADYALPNSQGYDEMKYCGLYHLNAYTYADPTWFPDFMRAFTEQVYGIPPEQVVGSIGQTKFELQRGAPVLVKTPGIDLIDDGPGKPVGIERFIGRKPIAAFGNSDGDLAMLQYTCLGSKGFCLYVHHTDAEREWAYDRQSPVGKLDKGLGAAATNGWTVVDMKRDWKQVFSFDAP